MLDLEKLLNIENENTTTGSLIDLLPIILIIHYIFHKFNFYKEKINRFYFEESYIIRGFYRLRDRQNKKIVCDLLCLSKKEYDDYLDIYNNELGY